MKPSSWRTQIWLIASGYAAFLAVAAILILARYLLEHFHRADVAAAGGMYAFGDLILAIFIVCLFMIPTVFLVWVMAKHESVYTTYSQLLVGVSLSAPVCLNLFYFGRNHMAESLITVCLFRLVASPFILLGIGVSRFVARFGRAKKLTSYALLIEGVSLGIAIALLVRA
ncbi:MAG TPA: hypothetical protein VNU74_08250 [Terriglobales bacterium]|nr:hypothetical protein [Terriglobales bacterium]